MESLKCNESRENIKASLPTHSQLLSHGQVVTSLGLAVLHPLSPQLSRKQFLDIVSFYLI